MIVLAFYLSGKRNCKINTILPNISSQFYILQTEKIPETLNQLISSSYYTEAFILLKSIQKTSVKEINDLFENMTREFLDSKPDLKVILNEYVMKEVRSSFDKICNSNQG